LIGGGDKILLMSAEISFAKIEENIRPRSFFGINIFTDLSLLLLALWLGASVFFSFVVAPGVFAVLPTRELAGTVVNRTLFVLNTSGFMTGILLLVNSFLTQKGAKILWERISFLVLTITSAIGEFVIAAQLRSLRLQMGRPVDDVPVDDPLRLMFNNLHGYSVIVLLIGMFAAIIAFFLITRRMKKF
jgi:hypothetical protein